jgi:gamma-glutamylcyclotransferase (GGCT)/AIG2-like uncharacterized protein YtfP
MTKRHVFVYGTLRRGEANDINRLLPAPRWLGQGVVTGAMYDLGAYPGVVLGSGGVVLGEVYAIEPALERVLDEIEEVLPQPTGEYRKREVRVTLAERQLTCLVYEIHIDYAKGKRLIASGDWVQERA